MPAGCRAWHQEDNSLPARFFAGLLQRFLTAALSLLQTHKCYEWSQEDLRRRLMEPGSWTNKKLPGNNAKPDRPSDVCNG